ncbi:MAG: RyR domain-containing protein [Verrucomicrobiota bacterium]|jgi:ppGpp synthetase/RelA/SpoT-type nucleotidyltranferase
MAQTVKNLHEEWSKLSDPDWVAEHVARFKKVRPRYESYAQFLQGLLDEARRRLAPLAIVQSRPKSVHSFAEKVLRKRRSYANAKGALSSDPLTRMTDLCGARVIVHTSDQVRAVCQFIEEAFDIDRPNSVDHSQRQKPAEFGYRSVHYIVSVNPARLRAPVPKEILGPQAERQIPPAILGLKAEIQVRTLLEHAWADIAHDLTYKAELKVPDRIQRQFHALAAVVEVADGEFGRLVDILDAFKSNFGACHPREEAEAEIARLRIALAQEPDVEEAVKLAHLALSIAQHETARDVLEPYKNQKHQGVQRALGRALCEMHSGQPGGKQYAQGRRYLEAACAHPRKDAETLCALAEAWIHEDKERARELFQQAAKAGGTEPLTLCRYLEFEIEHSRNYDLISLVAPMIRDAMERCRKQIEAGVNLPAAWGCLSLFHLLLKEPFEALSALAQTIRLCQSNPHPSAQSPAPADKPAHPRCPCPAGRFLQRTMGTLERLHAIQEKLPGFEWYRRTLLLGLAVRVKDIEAKTELAALASWGNGKSHVSPGDSPVILSGACTPELQSQVDKLRPHLQRACEGLSFMLLSGGTRVGISGLAGDIAEQSGGRVRAFGYLPRSLPKDARPDENPCRFAQLLYSPGTEFTPLEPLQGWTDLVSAGVDPCRVKLISYAGGQIGRVECAVALALGVRVGVVEDPTLPTERKFSNPEWQDHPNLLRLPLDSATLRAFLLMDELPCRRDHFEAAARQSHEEYRKSAVPSEPSLRPWEQLSPDLQLSNFHQIAYAENILKTARLGVRELTDPNLPLLDMEEVIDEEEIRRLAEMEHGRWNAERLSRGWKYAETREVPNKRSPYIVPWTELPESIREYDYNIVRKWPRTFRAAGLEIYSLSEADAPVSKRNNPST